MGDKGEGLAQEDMALNTQAEQAMHHLSRRQAVSIEPNPNRENPPSPIAQFRAIPGRTATRVACSTVRAGLAALLLAQLCSTAASGADGRGPVARPRSSAGSIRS